MGAESIVGTGAEAGGLTEFDRVSLPPRATSLFFRRVAPTPLVDPLTESVVTSAEPLNTLTPGCSVVEVSSVVPMIWIPAELISTRGPAGSPGVRRAAFVTNAFQNEPALSVSTGMS